MRLLTVSEAATELRISRGTAYRWVGEGWLPAVKVAGSIRIDADRLAELVTPVEEREEA